MIATVTLLRELQERLPVASDERKLSILRSAVALCIGAMPKASPEIVRLFDAVLEQLADHMDAAALAELSAALSRVEIAPPKILMTLAESDHEIAAPILERSRALSEKDLTKLAERGSEEALQSLARRATISISLSDILITRGGRITLLTLSANDGARFSDIGVEILVEKSKGDTVLQMVLSKRADLPEPSRQELAVLMEVRLKNGADDGSAPESHSLVVRQSPEPAVQKLRAYISKHR